MKLEQFMQTIAHHWFISICIVSIVLAVIGMTFDDVATIIRALKSK